MWRVYPIVAISLALASACSDDATTSTVDQPNEVRIALVGAASNLDPIRVTSLYDYEVALNIFETPLRYKYLAEPVELTTSLAAEPLEINDSSTRFVLKLRSDSRFSDAPEFPGGRGRKVLATDLVYSFKRQLDPNNRSNNAWLWRDYLAGAKEWVDAGADYDEPLTGMLAIDATTIEFTMVKPYPEFPHTLTHPASAAVAREVVEGRGEEFNLNPNGSGAFKLVSIDNSRAILSQNQNFPGDQLSLTEEGYDPATQQRFGLEVLDGKTAPFLDRLIYEFIPDATARWTAFEQGDVDVAPVPSERTKRLIVEADPLKLSDEAARWHAALNLSPEIVYVTFNHAHPALADKNLRCAIKYAQDWRQRNDVLHSGIAVYSEGVIPAYVSGEYRPRPAAEVTRARSYLAASKMTNPELFLSLVGSQDDRFFFDMFRSWLADVGYDEERIKFQGTGTFGALVEAIRNDEVMITTTSWNLDLPSASQTLQLFYSKNSPIPNISRYSNPQFDADFESAISLRQSAQQKRSFEKLNQMLIEDCNVAGSLSRRTLQVWKKDVIAMRRVGLNNATNLRFLALTSQ